MLKEHLIVKTRPLACAKNIVYWRDYRVTVLEDRLFRLEKNTKKKFRDGATQSVWFRDFAPCKFSVEKLETEARITTGACTLILKTKRKDCRVILGEKELAIDNKQNLLGTYRTLDRCNGAKISPDPWGMFKAGKVQLGVGVCSKNGIAYFDDAKSLTLGEDGAVKAERGEGIDQYIFAFGTEYRESVKALYRLTGNVPKLPRYALGNWWSRYYPYTQKEYMQLLERFADREIPLSIAVIDMDWHWVDIQKSFGDNANGWTGYSWNKDLFPDHCKFLKDIQERGLKITLNLHPADGIRWWEDCYENMAKAMGVDPATKADIPFDIANPEFVNNYFSKVHNPHEAEGVAFWWVDWQQGTQSGIEGLDPLWLLNHYHYYDTARNGDIGIILSRYAGIGSHRYPVGFSGDTIITWKTLAYLPYFTATASNVGYTWWSHDIGGHHEGIMKQELYLRHLQYGVFSPINRLHCSNLSTLTKEPWYYGNGAGRIAEDWLKLRHQLIPYLYSCNQKTHGEGIALVEPLYYEWQEKEAYENPTEYLFGGELLVAPVVTPLQKDGYSYTKTWLPEGKWTDIFTGDEYEIDKGGENRVLLRTLESIPVLAKAGAILPTSMDKGNGARNPEKLSVAVYNGDGEFTLFEDDGKLQGKQFKTAFKTKLERIDGDCVQKLYIQTTGNSGVIPKNRKLKIFFKNIEDGEICLTENGKEIAVEEAIADVTALYLTLKAGAEYCVEVRFKEKTTLEKLKLRAKEVLARAEGDNGDKYFRGWEIIEKAQTLEEYDQAVSNAKVNNGAKARLMETR